LIVIQLLARIAVAIPASEIATVKCVSGAQIWGTTPQTRAALYVKTGCDIVDNESFAAAALAKQLALPLACIRAVSDESDDTINVDPNAITPTGGINILQDIHDFVVDPAQIVHEEAGFQQALTSLKWATLQLGARLAQ
jgi:hypothetical protein